MQSVEAIRFEGVNERYAELLRAVEAERLARRLRRNRRRGQAWQRSETDHAKLDLTLWLRSADNGTADIRVR